MAWLLHMWKNSLWTWHGYNICERIVSEHDYICEVTATVATYTRPSQVKYPAWSREGLMPFLNVELMLIDGCLKYGHFSLGWAPMSTNMWGWPPTHTCTNWTEWVTFLLSVELLGRQEICWQGWWKLEGRNGEWIRLRYVAHAHEIFKRKLSEICRQR